MAVGNFTPDPLTWHHQGLSGTIKPGEIVTDRDRGWENHVLNKLGPRGLVRLDYGDDPKTAKKVSMDAYEAFWHKNIQNFNELNTQRKNEGKMYLPPSKELQEHADILGYEIVGPWKLEKKAKEQAEPAKETEKVKELEGRVAGIETKLDDIFGLLNDALSGSGSRQSQDKGSSSEDKSGASKKKAQ